ncbi:MAG TPA: type II toxin-antitoxin system RelE/ParE family toxin [Rhizomicrobium sp.]|nr:type II toxin-antitoxin system RelE/ParE family toxin [Rhizomicrobium sp.]
MAVRTFVNKDLAGLWSGGKSRIDARFHKRILVRLDRMDAAASLTELNVPGFNFHPLKGKPQRYSIHVNGPWCLTFEFEDGDVLKIDFEQYH